MTPEVHVVRPEGEEFAAAEADLGVVLDQPRGPEHLEDAGRAPFLELVMDGGGG